MTDTDKPKRRGRPATGAALSSTERSRRLHERAGRLFETAFHPGRPLKDVSDSPLLLAFASEYRRGDGERLLVRYARELLLRAGTPPAALASLEDHYGISVDTTNIDSVETTDYQADSLTVETTITETPLTVASTDAPPAAAIDAVETTPFTLATPAPAKPVSERDARILALAATGMKKRTIGTTLGIPESTVRWVIKQHGNTA